MKIVTRYNVHDAVSMIVDDDFGLSDAILRGKRSVATILSVI